MSAPTAPGSNPKAGLAMFAVGGAVILLIISWVIYVGWRQKKEIESFTDTTYTELTYPAPADPLPDTGLDMINAAAALRTPLEVSLGVEEMNSLLQTHPLLATLKGKVVVEEITDHIVFRCVIPFPNLGRYLPIKVHAVPKIEKDEGLKFVSTKLEGRPVPEDFAKGYHAQGLFDQFLTMGLRENKSVNTLMKRAVEATTKDGEIIIRIK